MNKMIMDYINMIKKYKTLQFLSIYKQYKANKNLLNLLVNSID